MTNYDDEIDLRPYLLALLRRWWVIVLLGAIAGAAALGFSLVQKRTYTSVATILVTRTSATLSLAEQFPTIRETPDTTSRMSAFLSIAQNDSIVTKVFNQVKGQLSPQEQQIDVFKGEVTVSNQGDAILITATSYSPEVAADIANRWARETVASINSAYSSTEPLTDLQAERDAAQQDYNNAQAALEDFIKTNQIDLLNARIKESSALFDAYSGERTWQINFYNQYKQQMETLITQAEALQKQMQGGTASSAGNLGDALALLTARFNALNISKDQTSNAVQSGIELNFQITNTQTLAGSAQDLQADVETLLKLATDEKAAAEARLESLRSPGPDEQTIEDIAANTRALQTELENENARKQELTNQRDLAWKAYQTLLQKVTEIQTAPQTSNEVTMAEPAVPAQVGNPRGTLRNALVGGVLGLLVGLAAVLIQEWWRLTNLTLPEGAAPNDAK
jgi:capsular polysaccharide biosynthesis protein